jgi:hypothetical protein
MFYEIQMTAFFKTEPKSYEEAEQMYENGEYEIDGHDIIMFSEEGDMIGVSFVEHL